MRKDPSSAVQSETRRLAAIMFTDIVGFSRQMGTDEARTMRLLDLHNQTIQEAVAAHHGMVIKTVGDAFLVDFASVVHAVQCAQQIQAQLRTYNAEKEPAEQIHVRIGIHSGDIIQREGDVFGDGVNIASRLQGLAAPDTICLSQAVYKEIEKKLPLDTVISLGKPKLKNIAQREPVYALLPETPKGFRQRLHVQRLKLKPWQRTLQVAAAVLLLVGAGFIGRYFYEPSPSGLPFPDKPSIAVLPFINMSGDPEQEYFSDGITEDLITDLSKLPWFFVIARNSVFRYKGQTVKPAAVSRALGVRYLLEGSIRKAGDKVRITAQLIDGVSGQHVWAERYERPLQEIFTLQDEIIEQIVVHLNGKVWQAEMERVRRTPTDNPAAYDYWLRGVGYWSRFTKADNVQARQMAEKALQLDPQYAQAYHLLSAIHWVDSLFFWSPDPRQSLEQALELGQKAAALDDSLPMVHGLLGFVYLSKKQHEQAIAEAERAITLSPNAADAYVLLGIIRYNVEQPEEALEFIKKGMRLNPYYPDWYAFNLGMVYRLLGRTEEAIAAHRDALIRNPNLLLAHLGLAGIYSELGREEEARAAAAEVLRISPAFSLEIWKQRSPQKDPGILCEPGKGRGNSREGVYGATKPSGCSALYHPQLRLPAAGEPGAGCRPALCEDCARGAARAAHALAYLYPARAVAGGHSLEPRLCRYGQGVWIKGVPGPRVVSGAARPGLSGVCIFAGRARAGGEGCLRRTPSDTESRTRGRGLGICLYRDSSPLCARTARVGRGSVAHITP
jgi:TolB-like protein/class 3 adenylate cyclase